MSDKINQTFVPQKQSQNLLSSFFNDDNKLMMMFFILFYIIFTCILHQIFFTIIKPSKTIPLDGVIYFIPETRKTIFWYIACIPFTFIYFFLNFFWYKSGNIQIKILFEKLKNKKLYYPFLTLTIGYAAYFMLFQLDNYREWPFYLTIFTGLYLSPIISRIPVHKFSHLTRLASSKKTYFMIFTITVGYGYFVFKPFLWDKLHITNQYLDIPGISLVSQTNDASQAKEETVSVDMFNNLKKYSLWGINPYPDIRIPEQNTSNCIKIRETHELKELINSQSNSKNGITPFFYQQESGLCFIMQPSPNDIQKLLSLNLTDREKTDINNKLSELKQKTKELKENLTENKKEIKNFTKTISYQFYWQILGRGYIHHQNHLIAPFNEILLRRPYHEIFAQYGLLNAAFIANIMELMGGINYDRWEKLLYSSFLLYLCLMGIISAKITGKFKYAVFITIINLACISALGHMVLNLGILALPRHFFDFTLFLTYYLYLKKNKKIYFLLSLALCLLSVLNNTEFGLILFIALAGSVFVKNIPNLHCQPLNFETISTILTTIPITIAIIMLISFGTKQSATYFLSGLLAFPIPFSIVIKTLLIIFAAYLVFIWMQKKDKTLAYLFLLVLLYSQALLIYWFRSLVPGHLLGFVPIYSFGAMLALKVYFDNHPKHEKSISAVILWGLFIWLLKTIPTYTSQLKGFHNVFENNKTYEWTLPGTNFISTMDPKYFTDSVELIQKYSPQEKGIYIISQYDNFLPFISGRYSALPVIDLQWYLITAQDMKKVIKSITDAKPEYLFAERNLDTRRFEYDIINPSSYYAYLHEESVWRAQRMKQIQKIFRTVAKDYEPVESSTLLTVYKRKKHAE